MMAFFFGDSFDCYALPADAILGYWDSGSTNSNLVTGRFSGSRAWQCVGVSSTIANLQKSSGSNDAAHHLFVAILQTAAITGTSNYNWLTLLDGGTAQCSVVFRSDGAMLLTSGASSGTTLATYTGALTAQNTWYVFEIEIVINNTTGSIAVRKNGNTSNDFSATSLNTRGGTANNYANRLTIGSSGSMQQYLDDLLWRSDSTAPAWVGDIRCYTRRPDTDAAAAWTRPGTFQMQPYFGTTTTGSFSANTARYTSFISQGGSIGSVTVNMLLGYTGNMKCTIFAATGGNAPGTVIQSATAVINNPTAGVNTFTFSPAVSIARGTQFFVGIVSDASLPGSALTQSINAPYSTSGFSSSTTYASFPVATPTVTSGVAPLSVFPVVTPTYNADAVAEPQQDAAASYVYSSAPGAQDLYTLTGISSTPSTIVGVTTRGLLTKSDAGTRLVAVQLRSGATTVQSAGALSNSAWGWLWRSDATDPATGAAWTVSGVAAAQIGAQVTG